MDPSKITPHNERNKSLQLETVLVEISTLFINLLVDQIGSEIENGQYRICELLDIDRSSLWQIREQEPEVRLLTHLYHHQMALNLLSA